MTVDIMPSVPLDHPGLFDESDRLETFQVVGLLHDIDQMLQNSAAESTPAAPAADDGPTVINIDMTVGTDHEHAPTHVQVFEDRVVLIDENGDQQEQLRLPLTGQARKFAATNDVPKETKAQATFGPTLDGPSGCYVGTQPPEDVLELLETHPANTRRPQGQTLDLTRARDVAWTLLVADVDLTRRQRRVLRRHAILSVTQSTVAREKLRAAAIWYQVLELLKENKHVPEHREKELDQELKDASAIIFEVGGAPLSISVAKKWARGDSADFDDLRQSSLYGMFKRLRTYDPTMGTPYNYMRMAMHDCAGEVVRRDEHPYLTRNAFKQRGSVMAEAKSRLEADPEADKDPNFYEDISQKVGGISAEAVEVILNGSRPVSLDKPARSLEGSSDTGDSGGYDNFGGVLADEDAVQPFDECAVKESVRALQDVLSRYLDPEESDIIFLYEGIGHEDSADLTAIGSMFERSRTWAGGRRKKALAKLRHPVLMHEIVGIEVDPTTLSDAPAPPRGEVWLDSMTERERYVAHNVLGVGGTPMAGTAKDRIVEVAKLLDVDTGKVFSIIMSLITKCPNRNEVVKSDLRIQECLTLALQWKKKRDARTAAAQQRRAEEQDSLATEGTQMQLAAA